MRIIIPLIACLLLTHITLIGQKTIGGEPLYMNYMEQSEIQEIPTFSYHTKEVESLLSNDVKNGIDSRCAINHDVNINYLESAFKKDLSSGSLYLLKIQMKKAQGMSILLDNIHLPQGARLFFISADHNTYQGAYSYNPNNDRLYIDFLKGDEFLLELYIPSDKKVSPFNISKLYQVYKPDLIGWNTNSTRDIGFNTSFPCQINASCDEANPFKNQIDATVRIEMVTQEGVGYCTGSFVNNTEHNNHPYLITAEHCIHGLTPLYDQWRFDYHYESQTCDNPVSDPPFISSYGSEFVAANYESDFLLINVLNIPNSVTPYLNGWNRNEDYTPDSCIHIQHPNADIKKVAFEYDPIIKYEYNVFWNNGVLTPPNSHFSVFFDHGTQQPGASGGPLIDKDGLFIGQLHGGIGQDSTCSIERKDYFGRLSHSWNSNDTLQKQLKHWLDPMNTNQEVLDGKPYESSLSSISGTVSTYKDKPVSNVNLQLTVGTETFYGLSDASGMFTIEYTNIDNLTPSLLLGKSGDPRNGLNVVDLVKLTQHILKTEFFNNDIKEIVADANDNGGLNVVDVIFIQKMILKKITEFPSGKSWLFFGDGTPISNGVNLTIKAAKIGDVNFSVDPGLE